jgi:hypothetical protein
MGLLTWDAAVISRENLASARAISKSLLVLFFRKERLPYSLLIS